MQVSVIHAGTERSGLPLTAVQIALACTSGPDIGTLVVVEVECMSWSTALVAPTTTILPAIAPAGTRPSIRSENDTERIVPGGPRKSIHAEPSSKVAGLIGRWVTCSALATASVGRPLRAWL